MDGQSYCRTGPGRPDRLFGRSVAGVGRDNDVDPLEFLQVRVTGGSHGTAERPNQVGRSVCVVSRPEEDFLKRTHRAYVCAVAARKFKVVGFLAPVPALTGGFLCT